MILDRGAACLCRGARGVTIGRLASDLKMGKSGLFDHFGSKQELEPATVERATAILWREVVERAAAVEPGLARLRALVDGYLAYLERDTLPGLTAAGAEFDARRGPVRDAMAEAVRAWGRELETQVELARARNELPADTEPPQIDFELSALATRSISSTTTAACTRGRAPIARLLG
jgi:AcrR family transcriptional regulator